MTVVSCFAYLNKAITQISRVAPLKAPRPGTFKTGLEKQLRSMEVVVKRVTKGDDGRQLW